MTVLEILKKYLEENKYDGLYQPFGCCGCDLDELAHCDTEAVLGCKHGKFFRGDMNNKFYGIIDFECCECDNERVVVANGMEEVNDSLPETCVVCEEYQQEYLVGEIGNTSCQLHDKWWYKDTPCFNHTQLGGGNCRTGEYLLEN